MSDETFRLFALGGGALLALWIWVSLIDRWHRALMAQPWRIERTATYQNGRYHPPFVTLPTFRLSVGATPSPEFTVVEFSDADAIAVEGKVPPDIVAGDRVVVQSHPLYGTRIEKIVA